MEMMHLNNVSVIPTGIMLCAHQYGVPTKELAGEAMEAEPKSASLTWPGSVSRMFPALISLRRARAEFGVKT